MVINVEFYMIPNINYSQMLLENQSKRNKQNLFSQSKLKQGPQNILQNSIQTLKGQLQFEKRLAQKKEREHQCQVQTYQRSMEELKRKLGQVNERYLISTMFVQRQQTQQYRDNSGMLLREQQVKIEQLKVQFLKSEDNRAQLSQQNNMLRKQITVLKAEKDRVMQIGLLEKIQFEERIKILDEQIQSKKIIILMMKKQLQKVNANHSQMAIRQRKVSQRGKDLQNMEREANETNNLQALKLQSKIQQLEKQNKFLKGYVKKVQKLAKKGSLGVQDDNAKDKLFQIKRQLALAKVQIGKSLFGEKRQMNLEHKLKQGDSSASQSQCLSSSDDSRVRPRTKSFAK